MVRRIKRRECNINGGQSHNSITNYIAMTLVEKESSSLTNLGGIIIQVASSLLCSLDSLYLVIASKLALTGLNLQKQTL